MTNGKVTNNTRPLALRLWLSTIDPGYLRLVSAGRAALAVLSIWLVLRTAWQLLSGEGGPPIPLLGVLSGLIFLLFIIDLKPSDRKISLWLAPIPFAGAIILASFLSGNFWLTNLVMLLLFFFSYFFRRYGPRAGELALVTTVGFYLGFLLHLPQVVYPIFLACVVVAVLVVYLWQFVIIPYNPERSLLRSVIAFYHNVAMNIATSRQGLVLHQDTTQYTKNLQRQFKQVHRNRRVIEGLFSATVSPSLWSQARLSRLQEEMFKTERGLELLIEAVAQLSTQLNKIPDEVTKIMVNGLEKLEEEVWNVASGKGQTQLIEIGDNLQSQLKSNLDQKSPDEWVYSLLRVGIASHLLTQSVAEIHTIEITWDTSQVDEILVKSPARPHTPFSNNPGKKSRFNMHPTTILGIQAVLATGLAMLAAYLLNFDKPNLVYWTAFIVIAGSTGESLRRVIMRVIGVIAGTVIGVLLAVVLPNNLWLIAILVTLCVFMTIYSITISYIWMVFWLNIGMLLVITTLGGSAQELVLLRPASTLVGAAVAALVVVFVLPIHVQNRFIASLSEFLKGVDRYIETYVSTLVGAPTTGNLIAEELNIDASYKKLELSLPGVTYEYNPLSRVQSQLASQSTRLAVLKNYVIHMDDEIGAETGILAGANADLVQGIQSRIHDNVSVLTGFLTQGQKEGTRTLTDLRKEASTEIVVDEILNAEAGSVESVRNRAILQLTRIHDTILQIASSLGAPKI